MFTHAMLIDLLERAVATFAQTFVALIAVLVPTSEYELLEINYLPVLGVSIVAALLAVLKAIAKAGIKLNN